MLENQIPFFVVERLYDAVAGAQGSKESLVNLLLEYISDEILIADPSGTCEIDHLLHLYYESFVPKRLPVSASASSSSSPTRVTPRATEMSAAGVSFVRRRSARDSYDVAFDGRRCMMEIPSVMIDGAKRPLLVNLIAFEQSQGAEEARVLTSYVSLMGMLVGGAQDVELLRRRGILENMLADDEEAARFFSHLGEGGGMNYERHVFAGLYEDACSHTAGRGGTGTGRLSGASISAARGRPFPSSSPRSSLRSRLLGPTSFTVFPSRS